MPEVAETTAGRPFVGRDAALAELDGVLAAAAAGRGRLVLVKGAAGIGKTTLAIRAAERAAARGLTVYWGACWMEAAPAFAPWAQALEAHARELSDAELAAVAGPDAAALAGIVPALASRLQAAPNDAVADPLAARFALFGALAGTLGRAAARSPLLLVLEDLHWADVASVLCLAHLGPGLREQPMTVLATLRDDEAADARLRQALAELDRSSPLGIELTGLASAALAELVGRAGFPPDPSLVDALAARTDGNPFFVTELLRVLAAAGPGAGPPHRIVASEVPRQVTEVVERRVARLPAAVADLLQCAAVLGAQGEDTTLVAVVEREPADGLALLGAAIDAGLLEEWGAGRWRFAHDLVRDALYRALPLPLRHVLHQRCLRALEPTGAPAGELARHALAALPLGDRARAVDLAAAAGMQAMDQLAYEEAAELYVAALDALGAGPVTRPDLLVAMGEARRAASDIDHARQAFLAAAAATDDPALLSRAALGYADPGADLGIAYRAGAEPTVALFQRALAALGPADTAARVRLLARLAAELYFSSEPDRARALSDEAVAMARRLEDPGALVAALSVHHDAYVVGQANPATALAGSHELVVHARATGDRRAMLVARRARVFDLLITGDLAGVDAEIEAFRAEADQLRVPAYRWWPALWRAMRALLEGRHADAEEMALEAHAIGSGAFASLADTNLSFLLFFLRREQGRLGELEPVLRAMAAERADIPSIAAALAFALAELGKRDEAAGVLARLGADRFARLRDRNWPVAWFQLARTAALVGDRDAAATLDELGRPLAGQCVMVSLATVCLGAADLSRAWLAEALGRAGEADTLYRRAAATNARLGARSWLAHTRHDHARALGDTDEARHLAELARTASHEIGLVLVGEAGPQRPDATAAFHRDGPVWELRYRGTSVRVPHAKGLADIAWLLQRPGEPVPAGELLARQAPEGATPDGSADTVLDPRARTELRARLAELETDLDAAEAAHDPERAARARAERDQLVTEIARAVGLGGRARRLGDPSERVRKTVTARIRNSIRRLNDVHPELARHLEHSIDTGLWCVYRPERPVRWRM